MEYAMVVAGCLALAGGAAAEAVERVVDYGGVAVVELNIRARALELDVKQGEGARLVGEFDFDDPAAEPLVENRIDGGRAVIFVTEPGVEAGEQDLVLDGSQQGDWQIKDREYDWDLEVGGDIPVELGVKAGAMDGDFSMGDLQLAGIDIEVGAAELDLDLRGRWRGNVEGVIEVGVGDLDLQLPGDIGLAVVLESGIGDVDIEGLHRVEGEEVEIEGFKIPGLGLEIKPDRGGWFAARFGQSGVWTNKLYGEAATNLRLKVKMGIGELDIEVSD